MGLKKGDLNVQIARIAYVDSTIFQDYLRDVLIPNIEEFREARGMPGEPAVLSVNNYPTRTSPTSIQLPSQHHLKANTFPPGTS
jgi:hypothetical protein